MTKMDRTIYPTRLHYAGLKTRSLLATTCLSVIIGSFGSNDAHAGAIETNIPDLTINWINTLTFSSLYRTETPNKLAYADANEDDSIRNIRSNLAAQRFDLLSQLDIKYKSFGIRGSASAWDDLIYNFKNTNNSAGTLNSLVADNKDYSKHTQQLAGYHAEISDLFGYGSFAFANNSRVSFRVGQFTQLWGESLFLATNGVSAGQNPIDAIKAQLLLNPQARDIYMPTPQISVTYEPTPDLSFSAYYKFDWRRTRISPAGSYFSTTDVLDVGADRLFAGESPIGGQSYFSRGSDIRPHGLDNQFGINVRYKIGDYDLGLYAIRYDDTTPGQVLYLHPKSAIADAAAFSSGSNNIGSYQVAFAKGIQIYGASFSTNIFQVINLAGEISARRNAALASGSLIVPMTAGNGNNVFYPMGDTLHAQVSAVYASVPIRWLHTDSLQVLGEIGGNHLLGISQNSAAFSPTANKTAMLGTVVASLSYLQLFNKTDVTPSVGLSWDFYHTSPIDLGDRAHTGNVNAGLTMLYNQTWSLQFQYKHFFGNVSNVNDALNNTYLGKDYSGLELQRTF
ncbi:MAG: DUF1302 domain-containing protein [Janthinobacterium lividum]